MLNNQDNAVWSMLLPVLDEHVGWFNDLVKHLFYAEDESVNLDLPKPTSFAQWVMNASSDESVQLEVVEKMTALHSDLFKVADALLENVRETKEKPSVDHFNSFMTIYEEFMIYLRRLEKELLMDGSGYDPLTSLRSEAMLLPDIKRELDRLTRQGKKFCVAMARIDDFDMIGSATSPNESEGYVKLVASLIKLSIRSFDDAYYMGTGRFAICLKQAEVSGGITALERLRRELERQNIALITPADGKVLLSMSCCIAEPVEGDDVHDLIKNLREDLDKSAGSEVDTVLKYSELSPLQRFIKQGGDA